jgi:hypothetical protein
MIVKENKDAWKLIEKAKAFISELNSIENVHAEFVENPKSPLFCIKITTPISAGFYDWVSCQLIVEYLKNGEQKMAKFILHRDAYFYVGGVF